MRIEEFFFHLVYYNWGVAFGTTFVSDYHHSQQHYQSETSRKTKNNGAGRKN